jgi:hypothetical protein
MNRPSGTSPLRIPFAKGMSEALILSDPFHGTPRSQHGRLAHRNRKGRRPEWSMELRRDLDKWVRVHSTLINRPPASGASDQTRSRLEHIRDPVHVIHLLRAIRAEVRRRDVLPSDLDRNRARRSSRHREGPSSRESFKLHQKDYLSSHYPRKNINLLMIKMAFS